MHEQACLSGLLPVTTFLRCTMLGWRQACSTRISRQDVTGMPFAGCSQLSVREDTLIKHEARNMQRTIALPVHAHFLQGHNLAGAAVPGLVCG